MSYCNGGHNPALVLRANGEVEWHNDGGTLVGLLPETPFEGGSLVLGPGDTFVLYSDGVTEAVSPEADFFGDDRLVEAARAAGPSGSVPPKAVVDKVLAAVKAYEQGAPAADDKTMVVVSRQPA